jgi:uncharacterized protein YndB with AHSA1/START domain
MTRGLIAQAATEVDAPAQEVWRALTDRAAIKQFFFGSDVESSWRTGSPIRWKGEWQGRAYEDKGVVLAADAPRRLQYTHFSPLMGKPDQPENYHTITVTLAPSGDATRVALEQDNNATEEERAHSERNWKTMLSELKRFVEGKG